MNSIVKKFLILVSSLAAQAVLANADMAAGGADSGIADRYALPPSKVYIESCQREVLLRHPGIIGKQQILHRHGDFWAQYEIQAHDGSEWFVLCDLATGKVIREQKLVDDTF
jgi:hypothetical protein